MVLLLMIFFLIRSGISFVLAQTKRFEFDQKVLKTSSLGDFATAGILIIIYFIIKIC